VNVSRETIARLEDFCALLLKWNQRINLISKSNEGDIWPRHVADSMQLYSLGGDADQWADLGSGGGFPGIVLAIIAKEYHPERRFSLVESDGRKCAFLREAARNADANVIVINQRIEDTPPLNADILSARALTSLDGLLGFTTLHRNENGVSLFPKGIRYQQEMTDAQKSWHFEPTIHQSSTDPQGVIVEIRNVSNV